MCTNEVYAGLANQTGGASTESARMRIERVEKTFARPATQADAVLCLHRCRHTAAVPERQATTITSTRSWPRDSRRRDDWQSSLSATSAGGILH